MATPVRIVLEQALALTSEQRLYLVAELLVSVDGELAATWEATRCAELEDRIHEAETGGSRPVPWAESRTRSRARITDG